MRNFVIVLIISLSGVFTSVAQCVLADCTGNVLLSAGTPVFNSNDLSIEIPNVEVGNFTCDADLFYAGIDVYAYQLLPNGNRMENCSVVQPSPDNIIGKATAGFGMVDLCGASAQIGSLFLNAASGFQVCDGAVYELEAVLHVIENGLQGLDYTVYNTLNPVSFAVLPLGTIETNFSNEFPNGATPLTTAVLREWNSNASGTLSGSCNQNIEIYAEGLSLLANCPPYEDLTSGIASEVENEFYYQINNNPSVDLLDGFISSGGQISGMNAQLNGLCYAGILTADNPTVIETASLGLCPGDVISVTLITRDIFTGNEVSDNLSFVYDDSSCEDCQVCPDQFDVQSSALNLCSGESVSFNAIHNGDSVSIVWTDPNGTVINNPDDVIININACQPFDVTITATATCIEDPSVVLSDDVTITVYPANIDNFISTSNGGCTAVVNFDPACGGIPEANNQSFDPGTSGIADITVSYPGSPCIEEFTVQVPYDCPNDPVCPNEIISFTNAVCSEESFSLIATVDQGNSEITWTDPNGNVIDPNDLVLINNNCQPGQVTFGLSANCADDPNFILEDSVTVTVYPVNIETFVQAEINGCSASVQISPLCADFVEAESITFNPGESGTANLTVSYPSNNCIDDFDLSVEYDCPDEIICPTIFEASSTSNSICSGESVSLNFNIDQGIVNVVWTDEGGAAVNPSLIVLTTNNCSVQQFVFNATATCIANPSITFTENVFIEVFPSDISAFVSPDSGGCSAGLIIDPSCGNLVDFEAQVFNSGESGTTSIEVELSGGLENCINPFSLDVDYDCPANAPDCPNTINAVSDNYQICNGTFINLSATVDQFSASYDWTDQDGTIINPDNLLLNNSGCSPETYTFTVTATCTNDSNVTLSDNVSINVYPSPNDLVSFLTPSIQNCAVSLIIDPLCGNNVSSTPFPVMPGETGIAEIDITYDNGPSCINNFTLSANYEVNQIEIEDFSFCTPTTINFNGLPENISCTWTPAIGLSDPNICNPVISATEDITYTINITDQNGCNYDVSFDISVGDLEVNISDDSVICNGSSTQLFADGGTNFEWEPSEGLSCTDCPEPFASPLSTTTYTVTVTDDNGCNGSNSVTITVFDNIDLIPEDSLTFCSNVSAIIDPDFPPTDCTWMDITGNLISNNCVLELDISSDSIFQLILDVPQLTNSYGCSAEPDTVIIIGSHVEANAGPDISICDGGSAMLNASGGNSFIWSPVNGLSDFTSASPTVTIDEAQTYTVTVMNEDGCLGEDDVFVDVSEELIVSAGMDVTICEGDSYILQGNGASIYNWTGTDGSSFSIQNPEVSPTSTTVYLLSGSDGICDGQAQVTVFVIAPPTADTAEPVEDCNGLANYNLNSNQYIEDSNGIQYNGPGIVSIPALPGTQLDVYTCNVGCCVQSSVLSNAINLSLTVFNSGTEICPGESQQLQSEVFGDVTNYSWSPEAGLDNSNIANPVASPVTTTTYTLTVTDINGCVLTDSTTVNVTPVITDNPVSNAVENACLGDEITFNAGTEVTWNESVNSESISLIALNDTIIPFYFTQNGCTSDTFIVRIILDPLPEYLIEDTLMICAGSASMTSVIADNSIVSIIWEDAALVDNINSLNPIINASSSGFTGLEISNESCSVSDSIYIDLMEGFAGDAGDNQEICPGESIQLNAIGGDFYSWLETGDTIANPTVMPESNSIYYVMIGLEGSACSILDSVAISINDTCSSIEDSLIIYNVFSPDNDGINETWVIDGIENFPENQLIIFNRWGEELIQIPAYTNLNPWDGKVDGVEVPAATYYYLLELNNEASDIFKGTVTIIR